MRSFLRSPAEDGGLSAPTEPHFAVQDLPPDEVRRRFQWAKRQGNPAWLWPEVEVAAWREALGRIETVAREVLTGRPGPTMLDGESGALGLACYTSGTGPLLGWWLERGIVSASPTIAPVLELHLRHNRLRAARMEAAAVALTQALLRGGVEVCVLKGSDTGRACFPEPGARPASDIDLLVHARDAAAAEAILGAEGLALRSRGARESSWAPAAAPSEPRSLTHVHAEDPWSVDLHSSLSLFVSAGAPLAELDAGQPMASRRPWPPCPGVVTLDQPLLLLHLATHAGAGLQSLTLLRLIELNLVIRRDLSEGCLSWDAFLAEGERCGALGYAYPALRLCEDLAPGVVPPFVLGRCARRAPASVVRLVSRLTPATAQRVERSSVAEHFMWSAGWGGRLRQLCADLWPQAGSWGRVWSIYEARAWRLIRGRISP